MGEVPLYSTDPFMFGWYLSGLGSRVTLQRCGAATRQSVEEGKFTQKRVRKRF
jgi:hypothetical protein